MLPCVRWKLGVVAVGDEEERNCSKAMLCRSLLLLWRDIGRRPGCMYREFGDVCSWLDNRIGRHRVALDCSMTFLFFLADAAPSNRL